MEAQYSNNKTPILFVIILATSAIGQGTRVGFYRTTCPRAEIIVQSVVQSFVNSNTTIAPGLLRMFFHDCFVRGCDASILLDGSYGEKTAPPNNRLRGFEVIDAAKSQLETICPGVVSCADILALAARDSVVQSGGFWWEVRTGRRDGLVSRKSDATNLPGRKDSIEVQIKKFAEKGLNIQDLVTLTGKLSTKHTTTVYGHNITNGTDLVIKKSMDVFMGFHDHPGGHTIGTAACELFCYRLYNFNSTNGPDPAINQTFLPHLRSLCPEGGDDANRVDLDTGSVHKFDISYYENLKNGRGILESDSQLWNDPRTQRFVEWFLGGSREQQSKFSVEFGKSMVRLGDVGVKTGDEGEIRRVCYAIN
ncbi:peroxidase N1 isoform X1 [Lactuca sativa]|nr:peroxidase N1 isoform X1 [Lactuca sativa]